MKKIFSVPLYQAIRTLPFSLLLKMIWNDLKRADLVDQMSAIALAFMASWAIVFGPPRHAPNFQRPYVPWELRSIFEQSFSAFIVCACILCAGYLLALLKRRQRLIYGALEVLFAGCSAWLWFWPLRSFEFKDMVAALAVTYIAAQGFENVAEGQRARLAHSSNTPRIP